MRRARSHGFAALIATALVALGGGVAEAAGPPLIEAAWVTDVNATAANVHAQANPNGLPTSARVEYLTDAAYQANLAASPPRAPFTGAASSPSASLGAGSASAEATLHLGGLSPSTAYRYRLVVANSAETVNGAAQLLATEENAPVFSLPDGRGWEMVSPREKNGGEIEGVGANFGGGVLQAAAAGGAVTYTSAFSFGAAAGAPGASQYISRRAGTGWGTENVTLPLLSASYPGAGEGVPYQLFSEDLQGALVSNGRRCRGPGPVCPVANPPLAGSGAPAGYRNYYLRQNAGGAATALLDGADLAGQDPELFEVRFAGATPDLAQLVLSSCAALSADAVEVPGSEGCDPAATNLYRYSSQTGALSLVNLLPGDTKGTPGAALAAQAGAVSADGSRAYFTEAGQLYLREGTTTFPVGGPGAAFQSATPDGAFALFIEGGHLLRYATATHASTDLTPGGEVAGVLGASSDASRVYYMNAAGAVLLWNAGTTTTAAAAAEPANFPPATGAARVSADGARLAFLSKAPLTGYDNNGVQEVFLYSLSGGLTCVSCNPTGERPLGASSIPAAAANGEAAGSTRLYKPRALSPNANRLFFDSTDSLVTQDTNGDPDVYQWEAQGTGSCARAGGCVSLISSGRATEGASFIDASADGADVFFLTDGSLVLDDPGAVDVYDARIGGGFPAPRRPLACVGDACQSLPPSPEDPTPGTLLTRPAGNPPPSFPPEKKQKKKKHKGKKHKGKGKKKGTAKAQRGGRR